MFNPKIEVNLSEIKKIDLGSQILNPLATIAQDNYPYPKIDKG